VSGARAFGVLREQPRGLYLVATTEFWERFSYWGMLSLLVLFLTASPGSGGFGWDAVDAVSLYALYLGALFSTPAVGGYLSSRYFGERKCIVWGGVSVVIGHVLLAGPVLMPQLVELTTGYPVHEWLRSCGVVLGKVMPDDRIQQALDSGGCAGSSGGVGAVALAYRLQAWSFAAGLLVIVLGTGFIKSTVSSIVGKLYAPGDRRRDEGFAIFMGFIYMGGISANFVAGSLGELLGWHYGFAAAALGMTAGLTWYLIHQRRVLGDVGMQPDRAVVTAGVAESVPLTPVERRRVILLLLMSAFVVLYAMAFYQKGGLLNVEAKLHVDRRVFGFEVPATWLLSVSTLLFILLTLPATRFWRWLGARGMEPSAVTRLGLGLVIIAAAYALLLVGLSTKAASPTQQFSIGWMVALYACFAVSDLLIWPAQIASVSRLAPAKYTAFAIGAWHLTQGVGSWLTGLFGRLGAESGLASVATILCSICAAAGAVVLMFHGRMERLAHGALVSTRAPEDTR
jgi:POT family proton-dependent oligopeptide transporter